MWPVRVELPEFAAAWYCTTPGPVVAFPVARVSHDTSLTAVQRQAASVCTDTLPSVCPGPASARAEARVYAHGGTGAGGGSGAGDGPGAGCPSGCVPACRTSTRRPATSSDPDLSPVSGFAEARNRTRPAPVPCDPSTIVIHDAPALAVHAQPAGASTLTVAVPGSAASSNDRRSSSKRHVAGSCVISMDFEPRTTVPRRGVAAGFGATV